jgi:hypothetical protein
MNRKFIVSLGIISLSLLGELLLWNHILVFSILLMVLAYVKHRIYPIKKELLWYLLITVGGTFIEIILVNFGHGWSYSNPKFFGIPAWIPLFWGLVGTTIIVLYDGLTNK